MWTCDLQKRDESTFFGNWVLLLSNCKHRAQRTVKKIFMPQNATIVKKISFKVEVTHKKGMRHEHGFFFFTLL